MLRSDGASFKSTIALMRVDDAPRDARSIAGARACSVKRRVEGPARGEAGNPASWLLSAATAIRHDSFRNSRSPRP